MTLNFSQSIWPGEILSSFERWEPIGIEELPDGARLIGHVPHIAPLAYLHRIPPPLSETDIGSLEDALGRALPAELREFYRTANGVSTFSDSIGVFGKRKNYQRSDFLAASAQPFEIETANKMERPRGISPLSVIVGYYGEDGSVVAVGEDAIAFRCTRYDGSAKLNTWPSFRAWLTEEFTRLDKLFDDSGRCSNADHTLPQSA